MKYEKLIIVESPTKVKSIEAYLKSLGYKNCIVLASYGHISNLLSKQNAIDVNNHFNMTWQYTKQSEKALPKIIAAAKESKELIIGTDPDREGEAIGWHIIRALKENKIVLPTKRLLFYAITKQAIGKSMSELITMREDLISAYLARLGLDFLVGFYISPLLWRKLPGCLSAGRVQSAALRNIVELEYERVKFKTEQYYVISGQFSTDIINNVSADAGALDTLADAIDYTKQKSKSKKSDTKKTEKLVAEMLPGVFDAKLYSADGEEFERGCLYNCSEDKLNQIIGYINQGGFKIDNLEVKLKQKAPQAPFITSSLQQEASNKLHFSPSMTMKLAQQLYEGVKLDTKETTGLITYMRTDNVHMSKEAIESCRSWIKKNLGEKYLHDSVRVHKSKVRNAQEAHECIRPTNFDMTPEKAALYLDDQASKLYTLIWNKAVASQMSSAQYNETTADVINEKTLFKCSGNVKVFDGWTKLTAKYGGKEDDILPDLSNNQAVNLLDIDTQSKQTQPPTRYTAASLIARMEHLGIGRPSTFTKIVDTLLDREYITKQEAYLVPTQRSWFLIAFLKTFFKQYVEYEFTANLETELDDVSNGSRSWEEVLNLFWKDFYTKVSAAKDLKYEDMQNYIEDMWHELFFKDHPPICDKCGAKAQVRFWHGKAFLSCAKYPDCDWTNSLTQVKEPTVIGVDPETGQSIHLLEGQYGPYLSWEATQEHKVKRVAIPLMLKPKAAAGTESVSAGENKFSLTLEQCLKLKKMPLVVGMYEGKEMKVGFGRFGPYVLYDEKFYPLKVNPLNACLQDAVDAMNKKLYQKPKVSKPKG